MIAAQVSWLQAYLATLATVQVLGLAVIGALVARRLPPPTDPNAPVSGETAENPVHVDVVRSESEAS